jgi:hypothetical protein
MDASSKIPDVACIATIEFFCLRLVGDGDQMSYNK